MKKFTALEVARLFGVPVENVRAQYAKNAKQSRESEKLASKGMYRGYSAIEYDEYATHAEEQAN